MTWRWKASISPRRSQRSIALFEPCPSTWIMRRSTNSSGGTVLVGGTSSGSRRPPRGGTGTGCGRRSAATSGRGGRRTIGRGTVRLWPGSKPLARSRRRRCSACCDDGARSADWRRGTWRSAITRNGRHGTIHGERTFPTAWRRWCDATVPGFQPIRQLSGTLNGTR